MIKFGKLDMGDHFEFKDIHWEVIPAIKSGSCGCVTQYNAQGVEDKELFTMFAPGHKVVKIETFKTHGHNHDEVDHRTRYYKRYIIIDDDLPIYSETELVEPHITDSLVQYEETDIWLVYFGLATTKKAPYYERLEHGEFIRQI